MAPRFAPLLLLMLVAGCSSTGGTIVLQPHDGSTALTQEFRQALVSREEHGEYHIVLLDTPSLAVPRKPRKNQPLQSAPIEPMQQVIHIHLHWTPMAGTQKNPAAINASLSWYILGSEGANDILVYSGAGFVVLHGDSIRIREGTLRPVLQRGVFHDPLGTCDITGIGTVVRSDGRVRDMIAQLRQQAQ